MRNDSKGNIRKIVVWLILSLIIPSASCTTQNSMKIETIPMPPGARRGVADSSLKTPAATAANVRLIDISERFGKYDSEIYELTENTDWQKLADFYDAELGKQGFARKTGVPSAAVDADIIYYENTNAAQKIAVSLLEVFAGAGVPPKQILLVAVSK